MPHQKITRKMVRDAAFSLAREGGMDKVLVKSLASRLGCSVQPIYSYYKDMEELRRDVIDAAGCFFKDYIRRHLQPEDYFRSVGRAYTALAKEEPHLFQLYFLRRRDDIHSFADLYAKEADPHVSAFITASLGVSEEEAKALHLHLLIYNSGISTLLASTGCDIPAEEIEAQQTAAYCAFSQMLLHSRHPKGGSAL